MGQFRTDEAISMRNSRLGIVSVTIGAVLPLILVIFIISLFLSGSRKSSAANLVMSAAMLFAVAAPFLHFLGAAIGIGGLFTKKTKKVCPVVGTILNIMLGISGLLLWALLISKMSWGFR